MTQENNNNEQTFTEQVEGALEGLHTGQPELAEANIRVPGDPLLDLQERGIPVPGDLLSDEAKETLAGYLEDKGMPVPDELNTGTVIEISNDVDAGYQSHMDKIKGILGWELFRDGFRFCHRQIAEQLHALDDDDQIALYFEQQLADRAAQNKVNEVQQWAERAEGALPGEYVPLNDSGHDFVASQSGTLEEPLGQLDVPVVPANPDTLLPGDPTDLSEGERVVLETEKTIRELALENENLKQASIRDTEAVQQWAAVCDLMNEAMASTAFADENLPLVQRFATYLADLQHRASPVKELENNA